MTRVRILVLTSSTGAGHDTRAQAFAEWCFELYRHNVDVRIEQMLEKSSGLFSLGVRFYNWIQQKSPWIHKAFFLLVELLSLLNRRSVAIGRGYYEQVLREYRPHLVFSVHDCLNRGYFQTARRILGADKVRCATYCGEFSGGFGYSINWVEPSADLYISRTATARDYAVKLGMPPERTRVRGYLMQPRQHLGFMSPAERHAYLEHELELRPDRFTVFLATGGNGANNHLSLLEQLLPFADRVQAVVICGKNREVYNQVLHWRIEHPQLPCFLDGYSEAVHLLMQVSDVIVTRGGTTSCAKALHFRCPILFNAIGGVMPQESLTVKFFNRGAGVPLIDRPADLGRVVAGWLADRSSYVRFRDDFRNLRYEEDPTLVITELVNLAQEVAHTNHRPGPFPQKPRRRAEEEGEPIY
ncbi:Processive diacylglycerol beta-glucosyltransferase [Lacunisphaera limnophila]|uniref:Processive diacylglycerol beta-glucosyltransferase n=1 Tax=Lacunisphaera limnophila TaxID=1838286 RepID=A0A1D8AVJ1_9BACT|nr:glycosyltransferase [Lacunisphaera limnophila]AOS44920.1 Processive diacylglycerol beta-glucosyltransferase [Lacunisphaera limnophila]